MAEASPPIALPPPSVEGGPALERLLAQRRSVRRFGPAPLRLAQLGQLLWAAQGVSDPEGLRTAPSAGALYPLELYVVVGEVTGLDPGLYRYRSRGHALDSLGLGELRAPLAAAALGQTWVGEAPAVMVLTADYTRTTGKYGERGRRYVHMEAGHAAQNLFLQAEALGLATVVVGAFDDATLSRLLDLPARIEVMSLMPVGHDGRRRAP